MSGRHKYCINAGICTVHLEGWDIPVIVAECGEYKVSTISPSRSADYYLGTAMVPLPFGSRLKPADRGPHPAFTSVSGAMTRSRPETTPSRQSP